MHLRISNKIIIYLFFFLILVTVNGINLPRLIFPEISYIQIEGADVDDKKKIEQDLNYLKDKKLFSLNKLEISKKIFSNDIVEELSVFKNYPSGLIVKIKKTSLLAITKINNQNYYIGSNGNFILAKNDFNNLPFIFGDVEPNELLNLISYIENSKFDLNLIKNLFFFKSKRWDIETKDGLIIKLPLTKLKFSLDISSEIIKSEKFKNLKSIDLRQQDQVIINND